MAVSFSVTEPHELGRMEAKRRVDKGIDALTDKMGLQDSWTDNVATITGSGQSAGITGTATVRNHGVDVTLHVPDDKVQYASIYEANLKNWLKDILSKA